MTVAVGLGANPPQLFAPKVSVIVPTFRDWPRLQLCIAALAAQTLGSGRFEVLIVNNDPADSPPISWSLPAHFTLITEATPGSYAARNAALAMARGEIIAFTDADCIPAADWLAALVAHLESGAERVAGRIELFFELGGEHSWAAAYEKAFAFRQPLSVARGEAVTANFATWRRLFDQIGWFNAGLMSGGDVEWNRRATAMGKGIVYVDSAIVRHPARADLGALMAKCRRVSAGVVHLERANPLFELARGALPPLRELPYLWHHRQLSRLEKFKAFWLCYYLKLLRCWFTNRLRLGLA